ncbi:hypothetical protein [Bdellovibrio bacteriovorus]|uniref:hypothetical protein n=1 Tax=Bdellovibrio TaxID=958 RepID=UPI0035A840BA
MHKISWGILISLSLFISSCSAPSIQRGPSAKTYELSAYEKANDCHNTVIHKETLQLWDHVQQQLRHDFVDKRLLEVGDVYALYDLEIYLRNFLTMVQRCEDHRELNEIVQLLLPTATALSPSTNNLRKTWICKGGDVCLKNKFIGKEVLLPNLQFAGLISSVINAISSLPANERTSDMAKFLKVFLPVIIEDHLAVWTKTYIPRWQKLKTIPKDQVSQNFLNAFDDKDIWMLISLSETLTAASKLENTDTYTLLPHLKVHLVRAYNTGVELLRNRISKETISLASGGKALIAYFDLGAWSRYEDMLFAGYRSEKKPLTCGPNGVKTYNVNKKSIPLVPTVNMDISHARRLVPLFETFLRNEKWMKQNGGLDPDATLSSRELVTAIANEFAEKVMSQEKPLFHTYMDGTNGWYRVDYSSGSACREGDGPYMSSYAGPTGGFGFWAAQNPRIGATMNKIYLLLSSKREEDQKFVEKYYKNVKEVPLQKFMFLPTLVGTE